MLSKLRFLLVCTAFLATLTVAHAQNFTTATVIPAAASPVLMVTADFNRDGHSDVAYQDAYDGGNLHVMLGNGDGTFTTGQVIPLLGGAGTVLNVGDLNGDGIPDIAIGYHGHATSVAVCACITILLGHGDGTFSAPTYSPAYTYGSPYEINFKFGIADFDGDGHVDIIYGDNYGFLYFMKGDGRGNFAAPVMMSQNGSNTYYGTQDVLVGDFNGDGLPDIAVGSYNYGGNNPAVVISLNQGGAQFKEVQTINGSNDSDTSGSFLLADMNGDGKLDVVLTVSPGTSDVAVAYGLGAGMFGTPVPLGNYSYSRPPFLLGAADLHGDGHNRVFTASFDGVTVLGGNAPVPFVLYAAGGDSYDESHTDLYYDGQAYFNQGLVADFNGDGYADVIMSGDSSLLILAGAPNGGLTAAPSTYTYEDGGIAVLDATSDGIPDLIMNGATVYPGRGDGTFVLHTPASSSYGAPSMTADFNGDGRLDFYAYGVNLNNGNGTFTGIGTPGLYPSSSSYATVYGTTADFNGDGFPDIAVTTSAGGIYKPSTNNNQVNLAFSMGNTTTYSYKSLSFPEPLGPLGSGDFNGDGCNDFVVGTMTQIEIFTGDCHSNFTPKASYAVGAGATISGTPAGVLGSLMPSDIAVADFDRDGHLDIVYTVPGLKLANVLWGNGDGTFTAGQPISLAHPSLFVKTADLDSDGNPDLIFSGSSVVTILHGTGTRNFGPPMLLAAGFNTGRASIADLNRDGNPDMLFPNLDPFGEGLAGLTVTVFVNPLPPRFTDLLTTTLKVSPEPSIYGQSFTATAIFTPVANLATPTGTATFTLDGGTPTTGTLNSSGTASATFGTASVGTHTVAVAYPGDANFLSASASVPHVVIGYPTTTSLTCTPGTIYVDSIQTTLLAANVTSSNGPPTGSVVFTDNGTTLATIGLASSAATYTYAGTVVGTHTLTATYTPTGSFAGSSASCSEVVTVKPSTITIVSSLNPSSAGQTVTFTATVIYGGPPQSFAGAGTVTFTDGANLLGTVTLTGTSTIGTFTASYSTSGLSAASHIITAALNPLIGYAPGSAALTQAVNALTATAGLVGSPLNETFGTPTLLTATVAAASPSAAPTPTGNVVFSLDGVAIATQALASGVATYSIPSLSVGTHVATCQYAGDIFYASTPCNSVAITVAAAPTALTITSSANPAFALVPVTFTVHMTINGKAAGAANTITLNAAAAIGGVAPSALAATTDANGAATFTVSFFPGSYLITAASSPTSTLLGSSAALTQVVTINATSTNLTAVPNPSYQGQTVTLTATVTNTNGVVPAGTVSFLDGATAIGSATLNASAAAIMTTSTLSVGTHPLTAVFLANTNFAASTSPVVPEVILPSTFTIALSPSTITLPPGHAGQVAILLQSVGNFSGPLALTYGTLPVYATASIGPAAVSLTAGGTGTSTLTLNTLMKAANQAPRRPFGGSRIVEALLLALVPFGVRRRKRLARVLGLVAVGMMLQSMMGCTNAWYTANVVAVGIYTVPVTATDVNQNTQTAVLTVVVTQQ